MKKIVLLVIFSLILLTTESFSEEFVREYTYHAGDDDSKNDSRKAALEQLQLELLAEVGVYVESEWEMVEGNGKRFNSEEIATVAAGITETEILHEEWDGYLYSVEAKLNVDMKDVRKKLDKLVLERKKREKLKKEIKSLKEELKEAKSEVRVKYSNKIEYRKKSERPQRGGRTAWERWENNRTWWEKLFYLEGDGKL
tara:strand:- start:358 stop:951 length:594 start_codon:yes stop_codon:yes gene_type:complete